MDQGIVCSREESSLCISLEMNLPCFNGVVYCSSCEDCDMAYVGQTSRMLHLSKKEGMQAPTNADLLTSALAEHAMLKHCTASLGE